MLGCFFVYVRDVHPHLNKLQTPQEPTNYGREADRTNDKNTMRLNSTESI